MNEKIALMKTPKRCLVGGHMMTVFLTDYQEDGDYYHGEAHRNRKTGDEKLPVVIDVHGLRPYPYTARPDVAFQFVEMGEDEQPLIDIAQGNAAHHTITQHEPCPEPVKDEAPTDPRDLNQDGVITKAEIKQYRKDHPEE